MPRIASRVGLVGTETALDVLVKARAVEARGRKVIHLEVGEPDFPTPAHIVEAGVRALRDGYTRHGAPAGSPVLREAIAEHLAQRGVRANPEHVLVTPGAKPNLFYGFLATLSPGDEVLVPDPGFPIYASMVRFCGATPIPVPPRLDQGLALDLDVLERAIAPRAAGRRGCDGGPVPRAARRDRRAPVADPGRSLSRACRRLLRLSRRARASSRRGRARGSAAAGGSGRAARWSGLRSGWIGIPSPLVRSFAGEPARSRGPVLAPGGAALAHDQAASCRGRSRSCCLMLCTLPDAL